MRLDRFLWFARFARTRSAAQALAEDGHLRISGRPATSRHAPVRVGDVLTFVRGAQVSVVRVEALPLRRGPAPEARACYTDLTSSEAGMAKLEIGRDPKNANVSQEGPCD